MEGGRALISFEELILEPGSPIYLQILLYIKRGVVAGTVADGDELPSRRVLSALLGVNPNTVQRAFQQLESEGVLHSERGSGWFVEEDISCAQALYDAMVREKCCRFFTEMADMGMTPEAVKNLVKEWEHE